MMVAVLSSRNHSTRVRVAPLATQALSMRGSQQQAFAPQVHAQHRQNRQRRLLGQYSAKLRAEAPEMARLPPNTRSMSAGCFEAPPSVLKTPVVDA